MSVYRELVCFFIALAACAGERPERRSDGLDAAAAEHRAGDAAREQAMTSCRDAFAAVAHTDDPSVAVRGVLTACADLHGAPACREAWRTAATVSPDMRIAVLAAGCQRAYCPTLEAPRPALCESDVTALAPSELGPAWAELERVILARELGEYGPLFANGLSRLATPIVVPVAPPTAPSQGTETMAVQLQGGALVISRLDDPSRRATMSADADAATIAAQIRPLLAGVERLVLAADASLPYATVVRVIDAARQAGVTAFAISVEPETPPGSTGTGGVR